MSVERTIHMPWLEESQLQEGNYFHARDPIPACRDWWQRLYYRKLSITREKTKMIKNKMFLLSLLYYCIVLARDITFWIQYIN